MRKTYRFNSLSDYAAWDAELKSQLGYPKPAIHAATGEPVAGVENTEMA